MSHDANPLRERNQSDKKPLRRLRERAWRNTKLTFQEACKRAKSDPDFGGHDETTIAKSVAVWEAKLIAASFIRRARQRSGLSQQKLAELLGVPRNYITQAESCTNDMKVPLDLLVRVAHATSTPLLLRSVADMNATEQTVLKAVINKVPAQR